MKKLIIGIVIVALTWTAASFAIGLKTETVYSDVIAELEMIPGQDGITYQIQDYRRSLFSSRVRACVMIDPAFTQFAPFSGVLCDSTRILHGPLLLTDQGPRLGLAYLQGELDSSALPEEIRQLLTELFAGQSPLQTTSLLAFDQSAQGTLTIPAFHFDSDGFEALFGGLSLDMQLPSLSDIAGHYQLTLNGLHFTGPDKALNLDKLAGHVQVLEMIDGVLPIIDLDLRGDGFHFAEKASPFASNLTPKLSFDMVLQSSNVVNTDSLDGNLNLWFNNVSAPDLELAMDTVYMNLAFAGLDKKTLVRMQQISDEIDQLQMDMMMQMMAAFSEQPQQDDSTDMDTAMLRIQSLHEELGEISSEQLLLPGRSKLSMQLLVDHQEQRQLALHSQLNYLGSNGHNLPVDELMALEPEQWASLLDANLDLAVNDGLVPTDMAELGPQLVSDGLLSHRDNHYRLTLSLSDGALRFNDEKLSVAQFQERVASLIPTGHGDLEEMDIEHCFDPYNDDPTLREICREYGFYPE